MTAGGTVQSREGSAAGLDWSLLRAVSRSFYLTLRLLPPPVRAPIALGYLAARLSDTVADGVESAAEARLLARSEEIRGWLAASPDRDEIERVWQTIQEGQRFDSERFAGPDATPLSRQELDRYTYLVAGCVGEFWTRICERRMPGFSSLPCSEMAALGVRFGKGLQLVNILRDRAADARKGRVYVDEAEFRPVLAEARTHLTAARAYVRSLRGIRLRAACALPLLLAEETLDLVEASPGNPRAKVSRLRVWVLLVRAFFRP